ncbi:MAG: hypothetical protein SGI90_06735 [Candidatus Eisenbacteria bacterium]|nr:hypothetical protein [Candidatus Eisenbacteria bacterium]
MTRFRTLLMMVVLAVGATEVLAGEAVTLHTEALTEVTLVNEEGKTEVRLVEAARVAPGDEVVYAIHWENSGRKPAEAVVITNPIPKHMVCTTIEEAAPARTTVSVDGGKSFGPLARLTVAGPNGTTRPATAADCTHVRWNFDQPLPPGHKGTFHFRANLL